MDSSAEFSGKNAKGSFWYLIKTYYFEDIAGLCIYNFNNILLGCGKTWVELSAKGESFAIPAKANWAPENIFPSELKQQFSKLLCAP